MAESRASRPFQEEERSLLDRDLRALRSECRAFLGSLPVEAQTASGLARLLGVERTTCQRLVSAVTPPYPGIDLATQLPGTQGLLLLVDAAIEHRVAKDVVATFRPAIVAYDQTVRRLGGSRSRLVRRVRASLGDTQTHQGDRPTLDASPRELLFDAASALTGRHSDLWLATHIFTPSADDRSLLIQTRAHGLVGHRATPDAVPLTFHIFGDDLSNTDEKPQAGRFRPLDPRRRDALLTQFSTDPPPVVHSKTPGECVVQTIDHTVEEAAPIDLLFGMQGATTHPNGREHSLEEVWALVNFPVRRMLLDVFMHRDLARVCIPALDNHLWRPDFASQIGERWQTRFASHPRLEVLSPGLGNARFEAYPRYNELLETLFASANLDPKDYVGHRCDVSFPLWRTGYRMSFDFSEPT